tara:strand:+ start:146 stop:1075 length:930 start_codon:yes stop_codon:yes gene_type:complete
MGQNSCSQIKNKKVVASFNRSVRNSKRLLPKHSFIFRTIRFVKYHYRSTFTDPTEINRFLSKSQFIVYDNKEKTFAINERNLTWKQKKSIRRLFMHEAHKISPRSIKLKNILDTHYYDRCLERYIHERLCGNIRNETTCWFRLAQNNMCIGWYDPQKRFDLEGKKEFVKEQALMKPSFANITDLDPLIREDDGYVYYLSSNIHKEDDPILTLVNNIQKHSFSNWISLSVPIVLGYSTTTKRYNAICGRHRIATLRYLQKQGMVSGQLDVMCHIVKYSFESLTPTRPYSNTCKKCMEDIWEKTYFDKSAM